MKTGEKQRMIETGYLKFMALSPQSKLMKVENMCQCLVNKKLLTQSESKLITGLFTAFKSGNENTARVALKRIRNTSAKSPVMKVIVNTLRQNEGKTPPKTNPSKNENTAQGKAAVDYASDVIIGGSAVAGAIFGGLFGPGGIRVGVKAGTASGKASGGMLIKLHNWLFGNGDGFMPGPNGEDCQPPFFNW